MSGMDELLDEAIAKAKEAGDSQLVEWLRMARGSKSAARWYTAKLRDLEAENAKLLEENTKLKQRCESLRRDLIFEAFGS